MNTLDFSLYSFILGSSMFLADGMISHHLDKQERMANTVIQIKPMQIDESYVYAKLALREKRIALAKIEKAKKMEMVRLQSIQNCKYDKQCQTMAQAIYFESRGESKIGKIAIGQVIQSRSQSKQFPNTIVKVVNQKNSEGICHFSYVCQIESGEISGTITDQKSWSESLEYAYGVINNKYPDYSKGADHYFNPKKVERQPYWVAKMSQVAMIGNHKFLSSSTVRL